MPNHKFSKTLYLEKISFGSSVDLITHKPYIFHDIKNLQMTFQENPFYSAVLNASRVINKKVMRCMSSAQLS
jgi:hypothetical protein